jgi:hypothetical protein
MGSHNQQETKPSKKKKEKKRNKTLSESTNREATNYRKSGKKDLQLNTPDPLPLKSTKSSRLHYSATRW